MPYRERYRTGDQTLVRDINLSAVMHHLHRSAPISRAKLAMTTGLNKTTISSLIQELIDRQFVREIGLNSVGSGRPSMLLELNPNAGYILSAEIGVNFVSVMCTDFGAGSIWQQQEPIRADMSYMQVLERLIVLLREADTVGRASAPILLGVAVGVPGLVDRRTGTILFAPNLHWQNVPINTLLFETFKVPTFVSNEAKMAALGEHFFGAARGHHDVLYISAGVGLGGGLLRDGQLFNGTAGFAGEFGHMTMDAQGESCNCGNRGCWETQVSQVALFRHIRHAVESGSASSLSSWVRHAEEQLSVERVVDAARHGDKVALDALRRVGSDLGVGIASLINALNPELVVLGGSMSLAEDFLLPVIQEEVRRRTLPWNERTAQIVRAKHGSDACVMGGVAAVYQSILAQPSLLWRKVA